MMALSKVRERRGRRWEGDGSELLSIKKSRFNGETKSI